MKIKNIFKVIGVTSFLLSSVVAGTLAAVYIELPDWASLVIVGIIVFCGCCGVVWAAMDASRLLED